jgi:hypothetical protein
VKVHLNVPLPIMGLLLAGFMTDVGLNTASAFSEVPTAGHQRPCALRQRGASACKSFARQNKRQGLAFESSVRSQVLRPIARSEAGPVEFPVDRPFSRIERVGCVTFGVRASAGRIQQDITNHCDEPINYISCITVAPGESPLLDYYVGNSVDALPPGDSFTGGEWSMAAGQQVWDSQISYCLGKICATKMPLCRREARRLTIATADPDARPPGNV